jgi:hypothetical protein
MDKLKVELPVGYPGESYPGFEAPLVVKSHLSNRIACDFDLLMNKSSAFSNRLMLAYPSRNFAVGVTLANPPITSGAQSLAAWGLLTLPGLEA